jgi:Zn-dependent protease with chaperone function
MTPQGKYYDGRSAVSHPVALSIEGSVLRIDLDGATVGRWPLAAIFRDPTHLVAVVIGCSASADRVEILDPEIIKGLSVGSAIWERSHLGLARKILIPGLIVFLILAGLAVTYSRVLTKYLASKVTASQEQSLMSLIERGNSMDECKLTDSQQAALDKVSTRLFSKDPENQKLIKLKVVMDPSVNAFTLPGAQIWILNGLLQEVKSPSELAGILAHEIEHVQRRHVLESMIRATLFTAILNAMAGDVSGFVLVDPSTAAQIFSLKLSREMEQEADDGALARLDQVGISPRAMNDFFLRLEKKDPTPKALSFLSTHPATEARSRMFEKSKIAQTTTPILSDEEWSDLKAGCSKP